MDKKDRIIVALDTPDLDKAISLVKCLKNEISIFKVRKELFTAYGNEALQVIKDEGVKCFLDLKYHDIPNTVAKASKVVTKKGVFMFNVHAGGGKKMMQEARCAVDIISSELACPKPLILAVTILTSLGDAELQDEIGMHRNLNEQVLHFATMAKEAGLDGVVASAREVRLIKDNLGEDFIVVTPGIRPLWASKGDQNRVVTPKDAFSMGVDYIVIGRPITEADDPLKAACKIIDEID